MPVPPCSSYKTARVELVAPTIPPKNGYKVKWRIAGTSEWYNYPNQTGSIINVVGVPACYSLEVSIQADCDGGSGTELIVPIAVSNNCYTYVFNDPGSYEFTPCGSTTPVAVAITLSTSVPDKTFCCVENSPRAITGGSITKTTQCAT